MARWLVLVLVAACGDNTPPIPSCRADGRAPAAPPATSVAYDDVVLGDHPVAFWDVSHPSSGEPDLTGNGHDGRYDQPPRLATMPNGDPACDFDGEALEVASSAAFSIPTTGDLTWEGWISPDALELEDPSGYVNWMGKCQSYAPTCEWEARLYDTVNAQGRCNRFAAYVFNPSAGEGAGAAWQPVCGLLQPCGWHHVVGEYTLATQPANCPNVDEYPGSIDIWVDGVKWDQALHSPTGCMSQFAVTPVAGASELVIGTAAFDTWFDGAIGKVAVYDYLLADDQIAAHFAAMTGVMPSGMCGETCTEP